MRRGSGPTEPNTHEAHFALERSPGSECSAACWQRRSIRRPDGCVGARRDIAGRFGHAAAGSLPRPRPSVIGHLELEDCARLCNFLRTVRPISAATLRLHWDATLAEETPVLPIPLGRVVAHQSKEF